MLLRLLLLLSLVTGLSLTSYPVHATVNESSAANRYTADGLVTVFNYTFTILDESAVRVLVDTSVQTLNTHYAVAGVGEDAGGTITFVDPPVSGSIITILRAQPASQLSDYQPHEAFPSVRVEKDYDKLVMQIQQLKEVASRSYHVPENEPGTEAISLMPTKAQRASKFFTWNSQGEPTASEGSGGGGGGGGSDAVIATGSITSRTFAERFAELYSVLDFGVKCDGVTDDSTNIQLAINTIGAITSGGTKHLRFPIGTCVLGTGLTNIYNNVLLVGEGQGAHRQGAADYLSAATVLKWTGAAGGTMLDFGPLAGGAYNLKGGGIDGIFFEGSGTALTAVLIRSTWNAHFNFVAHETTGYAVDITTEETLTTDPTDTQSNWFERLIVIQETSGAGGCLRLGGGVIGAGSEGNTSLNIFGMARLLHHVGGVALDMGNTDNNLFEHLNIFRNPASTQYGIILRASDTDQHARYNTFSHIQAGKGGLLSEGLGKGTKAAQQNTVMLYSRANNNPAPVTEYGASLSYVSALGTTRVSRDDSTAVTELHRATHTAGQVIGKFQFGAYNDADAEIVYGYMDAQNKTVTAGAEAGTLRWSTMIAGVSTVGMQLNTGLFLGTTPSGAGLGVGTINILNDYYKNGSNLTGLDTPAYVANVAIDQRLGRSHLIVPADGVNFTITAPTHSVAGDIIIITIKNTFGVLGTLTFNSHYKLGAAWTQPALDFQRSWACLWDGTDCHELWRSAVDVTN